MATSDPDPHDRVCPSCKQTFTPFSMSPDVNKVTEEVRDGKTYRRVEPEQIIPPPDVYVCLACRLTPVGGPA